MEHAKKLRSVLREHHKAAVVESRLPNIGEITGLPIPHLDAAVEEILRLATPIPILQRTSNQDTTLLGHHIPKGTSIMMMSAGPGFTKPSFEIEESTRHESSRTAVNKQGIRKWDTEDVGLFKPERWLTEDGDGNLSFNPTAGPTMPFGLGVRACFGKRLGYIQLKTLVTLIVWNFELLPCPENLSGYGAFDGLTRRPRQCYVTLRSLD